MLSKYFKAFLAATALAVLGAPSTDAGMVQQLFYDGIPGNFVTNLTQSAAYPDGPNAADTLKNPTRTTLMVPQSVPLPNGQDNYGSLIRGYLEAPQTGDYKFYIRSDDGSELWLSPNLSPASKVLIARVPGDACCSPFVDDGVRSSTNVISLVRGQKYYFEAIYKEGGGGDWIEVGWRLPDGTLQRPLPMVNVAPWPVEYSGVDGSVVTTHTAPVLVDDVQSTTVDEARSTNFFVNVQGAQPMTYQWYRGGAAISGENLSYLSITNAQVAQNGQTFFVIASNSFGSITSSVATLTVTPDTAAPTAVSAFTQGNPLGFLLVFSEPVSASTATNPANYTLSSASGAIPVNNVVLLGDGMTARLFTGPLTNVGAVTVTINNVRDQAATPNTIAPNSSLIVISADGSIKRSYYRPGGTAIGAGMASFTNHPSFINDQPTFVDYPSLPEEPASNDGANFGTALRGYVTAPETGAYTFYISADDNAVLFLSTDENPGTKTRIAFEPQWNGYRDFLGTARRNATAPENISAPINLTAGTRYYIEALVSEGGGGDNLSVGWKRPSMPVPTANNQVEVIPGGYLSPYQPTYTPGAVSISQQPTNTTVNQSTPATFRVTANGTPPYGYTWYRNNAIIPGANGSSYTTGPTVPADNNIPFFVVISNNFSSITSSVATLTVISDLTPPMVMSAGSYDGATVGVCFNELMDAATANNPANYTVSGGTVTGAALRADRMSVILTLASPLTVSNYTVTVNNVRDLAGNPVAPNSQVPGKVGGLTLGNLGTVAIAGTAFSCSDNDYELVTGGNDIWGTADQGSLLYETRTGYFDVMVRVLNVNGNSKGGLMARETLDGNSRTVHTYAVPTNQANVVESGIRRTTGGGTDDYQIIARPRNTEPNLWIRLRRFGDTFSAFSSTNAGATWTLHANTVSPGFADTLLVGLMGSARNTTVPARALFEDYGNTRDSDAVVTITQQPTNRSAVANSTTRFTVVASATNVPLSEVLINWQRSDGAGGFTNIPGSYTMGTLSNSYTSPFLTAADNGAGYRALVAVPGTILTSSVATVTVTTDNVAPTLVRGSGSPTFNSITLGFSEPVDAAFANVLANYAVSGGLTLISATVDATGTNVVLETSNQSVGSNYTVTVNNVRDLGGNVIAPNTVLNVQSFILARGFAELRRYDGIGGTALSALTSSPNYPNNPSQQRYVSLIEKPVNESANFGTLIFGYIIPDDARTGDYIFYISADDNGQFWLSTDSSPASKYLVAEEPAWNGSREFITGANQVSRGAPPRNLSTTVLGTNVTLTGGQPYYFEAMVKEGGGGDNLSVAWQIPGGPAVANNTTPIGGTNIGVYIDPGLSSVSFTQHPQDTNALQTRPAGFTSQAVATSAVGTNASYQYQRSDGSGGFTNIPGATSSSYNIASTQLSDNGAQFRVIAFVPGARATSSVATLTVTADTVPPTLISAVRCLTNQVIVGFSEPVSAATANNTANYTLAGSTITSALLNGDRYVTLTTADNITATSVTAAGVTDLSGNAANSTIPIMVSTPYGQATETNGMFVMEAEDYDVNINQGGSFWTFGTNRAGYSGTGFMEVTPNSGRNVNTGYTTDSPRLDYCVNIGQTGIFHIWIRGAARVLGGADDSVHTGFDNQVIATADRISPGLDSINWIWVKTTSDANAPATAEVTTTGIHTFNVWMREDGLLVDRVLLTLDPAYNPNTVNGGVGPAASTRGTGAPRPMITSINHTNGIVTIRWTGGGNLQSSTNVMGTYTDIAGATTGTYSEAGSGPHKFYRVRN